MADDTQELVLQRAARISEPRAQASRCGGAWFGTQFAVQLLQALLRDREPPFQLRALADQLVDAPGALFQGVSKLLIENRKPGVLGPLAVELLPQVGPLPTWRGKGLPVDGIR